MLKQQLKRLGAAIAALLDPSMSATRAALQAEVAAIESRIVEISPPSERLAAQANKIADPQASLEKS